MPFHRAACRLPTPTQDQSCANMEWCRVTDKKPTGVGKTKIAGALATRMESSGDMEQTLYMILEGRT
jgi:hypothetical protein